MLGRLWRLVRGGRSGGRGMTDTRDMARVRKDIGSVADNESVDEVPPTRREAMLKAWAAGWSFQEVAEHWGYRSAGFARAVIERAVAESNVEVDRDKERERFTRSLLMHHKEASEKALDPEEKDQLAWMRMDLLIVDRLIRLRGLDAPTHVVVTPGVQEFEKLTSLIAVAQGADTSVEFDPMGVIEAEVVDDDESD